MVKLINSDLPIIKKILGVLSDVPGFKLAYASAKTIRIIKQELEDQESMIKPSEGYEKYLSQVDELKEKYAEKRKSGKVKGQAIRDGERTVMRFNIPEENRPKLQDELEDLEVKFLDEITKHKTKLENFEKIQDEEIKIKFFMVKRADLPKKLTGTQFTAAAFILDGKFTIKDIPDDATQKDVGLLIHYFEL